MYAIIETGGKQYRVGLGDVVSFEKIEGTIGQSITFDKVLLIGGKSDSQTLVGKPYVAQASALAEIVDQTRGEKLLTIKYKRRKGYRRTIGHRQSLSRLLFTQISDGAGATEQFESSKRLEVLHKASIRVPKNLKVEKTEKKIAKPKTKRATEKNN